MRQTWILIFVLLCALLFSVDAEARRKKRRRYKGPPPTHPVVLWARTLAESADKEQRRIAAFKLSQYSQPIYQEAVVKTIIACTRDTDEQIKVLCTKALGNAGTQSQNDRVRAELLGLYKSDPILKSTIVRAFISRKDNTPTVHDTFLDSVQKTSDAEEVLTLLSYFEQFGSGSDAFVDVLIKIYEKSSSARLKRAVIKSLAERGKSQPKLVDLLVSCSDNRDTPLALTCLAGLQVQVTNHPQAWTAVNKSIESDDPDVLLATLDVINTLPESSRPDIAPRLVEIINSNDDVEVQEKAVLALGVAGDHSELVVKTLETLLHDRSNEEAIRIAAALVSGKQADAFPDAIKATFAKCLSEEKSQSLRNACSLGIKDLEARKASVAATNSPERGNSSANPESPGASTKATP